MPLLTVVLVLVLVGVLLWLVNSFIPMDPKIKQILNAVVVIAVVLWVVFLLVSPTAINSIRRSDANPHPPTTLP